jgi:hypothetical protein
MLSGPKFGVYSAYGFLETTSTSYTLASAVESDNAVFQYSLPSFRLLLYHTFQKLFFRKIEWYAIMLRCLSLEETAQ